MESKEKKRLKDIEDSIKCSKGTLEQIMAIFHQVDRRRKNLELEISLLEQEKVKLQQGQLALDV